MSEEDIVAAFAGADADEWIALSGSIIMLERKLDALRLACHNAWIASHEARGTRKAGGDPDWVRELDERAVKEAKAAKAAAVKARAQMGNLKLKLELYEL